MMELLNCELGSMDAKDISIGADDGGVGVSERGRQRMALVDWILENFQMEMDEGRVFVATLLFVEHISREKASKAYLHFKRSLDRKLYGKASERHPDRSPVKHLGVIEGGNLTGKQIHYHSIFVKPVDREISDDEFMRLIREQWMRLEKAMKNQDVAVDVERVRDLRAWVAYQTKFTTKDVGSGMSYVDLLDLDTLKF
jgi:hypothetical protein